MKYNVQFPKTYTKWTDDYGNEYLLPSDGDFPAGSDLIKGDHCGKCSRALQANDFRKYKGVLYGISCGCAAEIPRLMDIERSRLDSNTGGDEEETAFDYDGL